MSRVKAIALPTHEVTALLRGESIITRQPIRLRQFGPSSTRGYDWTFRDKRSLWNDFTTAKLVAFTRPQYAPCLVGDQLRVREVWRAVESAASGVDGILYADGEFWPIADTAQAAERWGDANANGRHGDRWRSPRSMPMWASRATVAVRKVHIGSMEWDARFAWQIALAPLDLDRHRSEP